MSRMGWYALELAAACIKRDAITVVSLATALVTEFEEASIKKIWRKAKLALQDIEIKWLEQQLIDITNA